MAPIDHAEADVEVLITGFGPWMGFKENPAWLSTRDLHDTYMSFEHDPSAEAKKAGDDNKEPAEGGEEKKTEEEEEQSKSEAPRIHIQTVQCAVSYSHVLSLIPLIHGNDPSSPDAQAYLDPNGVQPDAETKKGLQGNGQPFPEGYAIKMPAKGRFDLVIHVGVGLRGGIMIETLGHKRGYQIPDVQGKKAPKCTNQGASTRREHAMSEAEKGERARYESLSNTTVSPDDDKERKDPTRGFGAGYEVFGDELMTSNDVTGLVEWLQTECKLKNIRQSRDAGRYLCDFIFYCSLAEQKRKNAKTSVQFVHIPPTGEPQGTEECTDAIKKILWWLICKNNKKGKE